MPRQRRATPHRPRTDEVHMQKGVYSQPEHHIKFIQAYATRYGCTRSEALRRILDLFIDVSPSRSGSSAA